MLGSLTALIPYGRERYFENHKMMAAVDKLHKLFSTSFEPLVWARSVGLEVINELDAVKAALMISAGGSVRNGKGDVNWANLAAGGISAAASTVEAVRAMGNGIVTTMSARLREIAKR